MEIMRAIKIQRSVEPSMNLVRQMLQHCDSDKCFAKFSSRTAPDGTADTLGTGVLNMLNLYQVVRMWRDVAVYVIVDST